MTIDFAFHRDLASLAKILAVTLAVGLDVLAISIAVGVMRLAFNASLRIGVAFATAEVVMQLAGYELGTGAGRMLGGVAAYVGFGVLTLIGALMIRSSLRHEPEASFNTARGTGLLMASLSISLDSLGVGIALPGAAIPLLPLLITLAITTTIFTFVGLAFGARLGARYEHDAERIAGIILIALAGLFTIEQLL